MPQSNMVHYFRRVSTLAGDYISQALLKNSCRCLPVLKQVENDEIRIRLNCIPCLNAVRTEPIT